MAIFEVTSRPLYGSTEEYHDKLQSGQPVFGISIRTADLSITK
jgi:hypothetical protein